MKLARVLTELIGIVLLIAVVGCSSATSVGVTATPHAEATIEATLGQERAKVAPTRNKTITGAKPAGTSSSSVSPTSVPTITPTSTAIPISTPAPTVVPVDTTKKYESCQEQSLYTTYSNDSQNISWKFDRTPEVAGVTQMYFRTSPSEHEGLTEGFGLLSLDQIEITDLTQLSYQHKLINPSGYQLAVDTELITEYSGGMTCQSSMFSDLMYPEGTELEKQLALPEGIDVNRSRYQDIVIPEPTLEALIFAFAEYDGGHAPSLDDIDYSLWTVNPAQIIRDYSPELNLYLFGDGLDYGDWEAAALMLEVLGTIDPELNPKFATNVDEVSLGQFHTFCEDWMLQGSSINRRPPNYRKHCNMTSNAAAYSDNPQKSGFADSRGFLWFQSRIVTEPHQYRDEQAGDIATNPCCTINFHELAHSIGLHHNYCAYSSVGRWEDRPFMTKPFSEDDLAGFAVHLDRRTTHGMTLEEAADALGIEKNERYYELIEKPWLACGEQHPSWEQFADLIYQDHISSEWVETNNR